MDFESGHTFHRKKPNHGDLHLVNFNNYKEYLDSMYNDQDECYLQDKSACRKIAELGYRRDGTLSKEEFWKRREIALEYLSPVQINVMASKDMRYGDPSQIALAIRERANRAGMICTIIFINYTTPKGREISGYIDYSHSLLKKDWLKFFKNDVIIYPDQEDLGYYDWKKGKTLVNNSINYKTLMSPKHGLVFQHKHDRMIIIPDPYAASPGPQTRRIKFKSEFYNSFVLIDHVLRCRK